MKTFQFNLNPIQTEVFPEVTLDSGLGETPNRHTNMREGAWHSSNRPDALV